MSELQQAVGTIIQRCEPLLLTVRDGSLVEATGGGEAAAQYLAMLDAHGPPGRNLAALGVGTNDRATLTGNIVEDEWLLR